MFSVKPFWFFLFLTYSFFLQNCLNFEKEKKIWYLIIGTTFSLLHSDLMEMVDNIMMTLGNLLDLRCLVFFEKWVRVNLSPFPHPLYISSPFLHSLSISSSFFHSLSIFSQPGWQAGTTCAAFKNRAVSNLSPSVPSLETRADFINENVLLCLDRVPLWFWCTFYL